MKSCRSLGALLTIGLIVGAAGTARATIVYNFDGPSEQGWTDVLVSAVADANTDWDAVDTDTFAGRDPQAGDGWIAAATSGAGGWDQRDGDNDPFVLRSPTFYLDNSGDLTFYFQGGQQGGAAPANFSGLGGTGFLGLALREEATGNYVLSEHRGSNDDGWVAKSFTAGQLAPFVGGQYTLDMIDDKKGGWGWGGLDTVEIPGTSLPPSTPGATLFWDGSAGNWTNPVWLDDVPGTGSNTGTYPQDIASVVNPANITEGAVTVNSNEEAYSLTMDTGTAGSGGRPGDGVLNITSNTLTIHEDATIASISALTISPGGTLDVGGTLTIDPTATFVNSGTANAVALAGAGTATLNAASKLKAGSGTLGVIALTGNAEVEVGGSVTVGQLNLPATTTVTKSGTGTLDVTGATTLLGGQIYNPTDGVLKLSGVVSGSVDLVKQGAGTLHLSNNNNYTGATSVNDGVLLMTNGGALGDTAGDTLVADGAELRLDGGFTIPSGESITIAGSGTTGAIHNLDDNNEIDGPVSLSGNATIRVNDDRLRLDGGLALGSSNLTANVDGGETLAIRENPITGSGNITKEGDGDLNIRVGSPGFSGQVNINNGVVDVETATNGLGTGPVVVQGGGSPGTLRLDGNSTLANPITINGNGQDQGAIRNDDDTNTLSGTLTVASNSRIDVDGGETLIVSGQVTGPGNIEKVDSGRMVLTNAGNNFTGDLNINGGVVSAPSQAALGSAASGVNANGGTLEIDGAWDLTAKPASIAGQGAGGVGAINSTNGDTTISQAIAVAGNAAIGSGTAGDTLTINGPINLSATADLTFTGAGDIVVNTAFGNGAAPVAFNGLMAMRFNTNTPASDIDFGAVGAYTVNPDQTISQTSRLLSLTPDIVALQDIALNMDRNGAAAPAPGNGPFQWQAVFGSSVSGDKNNFEVAWTGEFSPDANGDFTFRSHDKNFTGGDVDDDASIFIDLDQDGVFQASEGFLSDSGDAVTVTGLDATKKYRMAIGFHEGNGDEEVSYTFQGTAGAFTSETGINPGAAAQSGVFTTTLTPDNSVIKKGTGTTTFAVAPTYNGDTTVEEGTLVAAANITVNNSRQLRLGGGATFTATTGTFEVGGVINPDKAETLVLGGAGSLVTVTTPGVPVGYPTGNLQALYTFDDGTATDWSGNGHSGTFSGDATTSGDVIPGGGQSLALDGNGDKVTASGINIANSDFSVGFWVNRDDLGEGYVIGHSDQGNNKTLHIGFRDDNTFTFAFWNDDLDVDDDAWNQTDDWVHLVCTYDADTNLQSVYLNGKTTPIETRTASNDFSGTQNLLIGCRKNTDHYYAGLVDEVYVYDRALNETEVAALYNGGAALPRLSTDTAVLGNLTGSGTIDVTGTGGLEITTSVAPGASIGALTVNGNLAFSQDSALVLEILGSEPGVGHDQLIFGGDLLELNSALLELEALFAPDPAPLEDLVIVDVLNPDALLTGVFRDPNSLLPLNEGDLVTDLTGEYSWSITYQGGDGKDVVLTPQADVIPEPATLTLLGLGALCLARRRKRR